MSEIIIGRFSISGCYYDQFSNKFPKERDLSALKWRDIHVKIPKRRWKACIGGSNYFLRGMYVSPQ